MSKFDLSKPYRTRDGREAQAIAGPDGCLYGWIHDKYTGVFWWNPDGSAPGNDSNVDLVNIPEKRTVKVWINVYAGGDWFGHRSRVSADANAPVETRLACIEREIEFEVGEGLEEK